MIRLISKIRRQLYPKHYPTLLVYQDGSTITIRHDEPREIIKLPVTYASCLTTASKSAWQLRRRPREAIKETVKQDKITFDPQQYIKNMKKRK